MLPVQEFLALLRLHGVPVTPSQGMPSGPRTVMEPLEKRSVVGRGLRHPPATYAAALGQPHPRRQREQQQVVNRATQPHCRQGCGCAQPPQQLQQQQEDADMADASQPAAALDRRQNGAAERPSPCQMAVAVTGLLEAVVPQHMRQVSCCFVNAWSASRVAVFTFQGHGERL